MWLQDEATNLATAISLNSATLGLTAASGTGTVTLTASTPGTTGNTVTLADTLTGFSWTGAALAGGSDGATSGTATPPTFAYWSGASYTTPTLVASNIATAVNARPSLSGVLSATSSGNAVTFTAAAAAGNSYTVTPSSFPAYSGTTTLSGGATATVQPNASPAKYGPSLTTASCSDDFVVYPTGQPGSATAAGIIAYNNIYSSCGGNVPTTYWAFNTESGANTGYTATTSPTLSYDGTKVAFVQSNGSASQLVVLKWTAASGTLTAPTAPTLSGDIATCTAPCMTVTNLAHNDSYSSPFYVYYSTNDVLYVGDDSGNLEEFTGVFDGAISGATAILGHTNPLASPVYDPVSGCVFVGDTLGYLYSVNSGTPGTVCTSNAFSAGGRSELLSDGNAGSGIYDAPLVDSASGAVYAFVASNAASTTTVTANEAFLSATLTGTGGTGGTFTTAEDGKAITGTNANVPVNDTITATGVNTGSNTARLTTATTCGSFGGCGPYTFTITLASGGFNTVDQFTTSTIGTSTTAAPVATQEVGTGGDGYPLFAGALDNVYYGSTNEAQPSGNLYVIGNTGVTTGATLYTLPIAAGVLGAPSAAVTGLTPNGTGDYPWPSPITEFCNGTCTVSAGATTVGTDYIFFSVNKGNVAGSCTGGATTCIESYRVNSPSTILREGAQNYPNPGTNGCFGTGGIVIDNDSATTGASEIYFISLNGATAGGGVGGGTATSSHCTTGGAPTILAIQAQQANP